MKIESEDGLSGHHLFYTISYTVGWLWWRRTVLDRVAVNGSYVRAESRGWRECGPTFALRVLDAVQALNIEDGARRLYSLAASHTTGGDE